MPMQNGAATALQQFIGMFAFVIYDERAQKFLAGTGPVLNRFLLF